MKEVTFVRFLLFLKQKIVIKKKLLQKKFFLLFLLCLTLFFLSSSIYSKKKLKQIKNTKRFFKKNVSLKKKTIKQTRKKTTRGIVQKKSLVSFILKEGLWDYLFLVSFLFRIKQLSKKNFLLITKRL